jgi:hypothetical protein
MIRRRAFQTGAVAVEGGELWPNRRAASEANLAAR